MASLSKVHTSMPKMGNFSKNDLFDICFASINGFAGKMNQAVGKSYPCCLQEKTCLLFKGIIRNEWRLACRNLQNGNFCSPKPPSTCQLPIMLKKADIENIENIGVFCKQHE
jgi:hypothetical protein